MFPGSTPVFRFGFRKIFRALRSKQAAAVERVMTATGVY